MCSAICELAGWLGWLVFLALAAGTLGWLNFSRYRRWRRLQALQRYRAEQVRRFQRDRLRERRPRCVQIGALAETVEILDEPLTQHDDAIVRIKHRNGENVNVDYATLRRLMRTAAAQRGSRRTSLTA